MSEVGEDQPEFLQIRDEIIDAGGGPADIVFGLDPFDARIGQNPAAYTRALRAGRTNVDPKDADKPVGEVLGSHGDRNVLLDRLIEHVESVRPPTAQEAAEEAKAAAEATET